MHVNVSLGTGSVLSREQDREHAEEERLPVRRLLRSSHDRQAASACSCRYAREINEMDCFRCCYGP